MWRGMEFSYKPLRKCSYVEGVAASLLLLVALAAVALIHGAARRSDLHRSLAAFTGAPGATQCDAPSDDISIDKLLRGLPACGALDNGTGALASAVPGVCRGDPARLGPRADTAPHPATENRGIL